MSMIATGIGAVGSIASGIMGSKSAKKAASAQAAAQAQAMQFQREQANIARSDRKNANRKVKDLLSGAQDAQTGALSGGLENFRSDLTGGIEDAQGTLSGGIQGFQTGLENLQGDIGVAYDSAGNLIQGGIQDARGIGQNVLDQRLGLASGLQGVSGSQYGDAFGEAVGTLQEGVSDDALDRRLDKGSEALNRQLAARGLLNSGAAIEGQGELARNTIDAFEQQRLANAGALGNIALQGSQSDLGAASAGANLQSGALSEFGGLDAQLAQQGGALAGGNVLNQLQATQGLGQLGLQAGLTGAGQQADLQLQQGQALGQAELANAQNISGVIGAAQGGIADAELATASGNANTALSLGQGLSNAAGRAGDAQAAGIIGQGNAITGALSGVAAAGNQAFQNKRLDANLDKIIQANRGKAGNDLLSGLPGVSGVTMNIPQPNALQGINGPANGLDPRGIFGQTPAAFGPNSYTQDQLADLLSPLRGGNSNPRILG